MSIVVCVDAKASRASPWKWTSEDAAVQDLFVSCL